MDRLKTYANGASGIFGFAAPALFAWIVYQEGIPQNVATWSMTLLLDAIGLFLVYKAGNKRPFLQLGWFCAAFLILAAVLFGKSPWHWGWVETASLVLCGVSVILWLTLDAKIAVFAFIAAMVTATVPLMVDYWDKPQTSTFWLWVATVATCLLSVFGAKKWDVSHLAVPVAAILMNAFIAFLCVR